MQKNESVERLAFSVEETAESIGVSSRTVWDYIRDGSIKCFRVGKRVLVSVEELKRFILERTGGGTQTAVNKGMGYTEQQRKDV